MYWPEGEMWFLLYTDYILNCSITTKSLVCRFRKTQTNKNEIDSIVYGKYEHAVREIKPKDHQRKWPIDEMDDQITSDDERQPSSLHEK